MPEIDNTDCVERKADRYTFRAVTGVPEGQHNLCMAQLNDPIAKESGNRIRAARQARGWTQKKLSEAMGWNETEGRQPVGALKPSAIGNYEQGARRVGWEEALALSRVFTEYPPAYFMAAISETEAAIIHAVQKGTQPRAVSPFAETIRPRKRHKPGKS